MKRFMKGIVAVAMVAAIATPAFAKTASIKISDKEMKLDISGFVQAAYINTENNLTTNAVGASINGAGALVTDNQNANLGDYSLAAAPNTFTLNRLQVNFAGQPADKITVKTTIELGRNFNTGTNDTRVVDAIIDLAYINNMTLRVGQFPLPLGLEIEKSPYDLDFVNYTLMTQLMSQRNRGAMIYGNLMESVGYDLGIANGVSSGSLTGATNEAQSDSKQMFGRLSIAPIQDMEISLFANYNKSWVAGFANAKTKTKNTVMGLGWTYKYTDWGFEAAYAESKLTATGVTGTAKNKDLYGAVTYEIPETDVQLALRYEREKDIATGITPAPIAKVLTAGVNWDFDKNARLQIQREFWSSNIANTDKNDLTVVQLGVAF